MTSAVRFLTNTPRLGNSACGSLDLPGTPITPGGWRTSDSEDTSRTVSSDVSIHLPSEDSDTQASDSEDYDTDLEADRDPVKLRKEAASKKDKDDVVLADRYVRACAQSKPPTYPQRRMSEGLAKGIVNLKLRSLGSSPVLPLSKALQDNLRVERLSLEDADIGAEGTYQLCRALVDNITVHHLNLSGNNMGSEGAKYVGYLMTKNNFIQTLNLASNQLDDHAAPFLANALAMSPVLELLDLSYNQLAEGSGRLFGAALLENQRLETLKIQWNQIRGKGAVALGQSLKVNDSLRVMDISWNGFGYEGSLALSNSLKANQGLRELNLTNNRVDWRCALLLAGGLKENSTLRILRIGRNPLTTTGCMDLLEAVSEESSAVSLLDMSGVPITAETDMLARMVGSARDFKVLHGGIVCTPDVIGSRRERQLDPMEHVMRYLRVTMLRPLELLRDFDKDVSFIVTEEEFIDRIRRAGVPMHKFEIRQLAQAIGDKRSDGLIDYATFVESIDSQILKDRMRKWRERMHKRKIRTYHKKIMGSGLPSIEEGQGRKSDRSGWSTTDLTQLPSAASSLARGALTSSRGAFSRSESVPMVPSVLERILGKEASTEPAPPPPASLRKKPSTLSLSAPLSTVGRKTKKRRKRKVKKTF